MSFMSKRTYDPQLPGAGDNGKLSFDPKRPGAGAQGDHAIDGDQQCQRDGNQHKCRKECGHERIGCGNANCIHINGYACVKNVGRLWGDGWRGCTSGCKRLSSRHGQIDVGKSLSGGDQSFRDRKGSAIWTKFAVDQCDGSVGGGTCEIATCEVAHIGDAVLYR